ncbi:MAG TPA: glycosyltransferase family 2 protein [Gammaproteobacteria bacterium]|nr:glycosyltransferase family 2 protein [Gammaproteobacteria bacterium]
MGKKLLKTVIIIPTFNERDNIGLLIDALQSLFPALAHETHILVVDDNSPDGTADVVRELRNRYTNLHLVVGRKAGLGSAYIRGMRFALDELQADIVFEMDADFSHKPEDVPRLLDEIDAGADFVIGSRYVKGGSIPPDWGLLRRLNSWGGNIAVRYIVGIPQIRDCTAGFRAIRASLLRQIDLDGLDVQGYAFQVVLLYAAQMEKAVIREVPVDFINRERGESKLGISDIIEFLANVWWIRLENSTTFIKFGIVGLTGIVVNLGLFSLLLQAGLNKYIASPVAIELSIIWNFLLNNGWTFRSNKTVDRLHVKGLAFNVISLLALGASYSVFIILSRLHPEGAPQLHQLVGIIPAIIINYLMNLYWTFGYADER